MTFNVKLLPNLIPSFFTGIVGTFPSKTDPELLATAICEKFLLTPKSVTPDVVALNEVFDEKGRQVIETNLAALYPHRIRKFGTESVLSEDAGLMLLSKFPILSFPDGSNYKFFKFLDSAGMDALANKGLGVVKIETPIGILIVVLTHVQAFYDSEDEYQDIRSRQLSFALYSINSVLSQPSDWSNVIFVGNFNVRGDRYAKNDRQEWRNLFSAPGTFSTRFFDGWDRYMRPPLSVIPGPEHIDQGNTYDSQEQVGADIPVGGLSRLDYQCFGYSDVPFGQVKYVPQHMRTRFRTLSDHWSLESDIHLLTDRCTPSTATIWNLIEPEESMFDVRIAQLNIQFPGSYQWVYVGEEGTYTINCSNEVEASLYLLDDLSGQWLAYEVKKESTVIKNLLAQHRINIFGEKYVMPGPFYIRIRHNPSNKNFTGPCKVSILKHKGETRDTAFYIRPWDPLLNPNLKSGMPNGPLDECWFRTDIPQATVKQSFRSTFLVKNDNNAVVTISFFDPADTPTTATANESTFTIPFDSEGNAQIFLLLKRSALTDVAFEVGWTCPLTYLKESPDKLLKLRCLDETGWDELGGDEIKFQLYVDGFEILQYNWDGVDTGEDLGLKDKLPYATTDLAFLDNILLAIGEMDFDATGNNFLQMDALGESESQDVILHREVSVQTGRYRFEGILSRTPSNKVRTAT